MAEAERVLQEEIKASLRRRSEKTAELVKAVGSRVLPTQNGNDPSALLFERLRNR